MFYYYLTKTFVSLITILITIKQIISNDGYYINEKVPQYLKYSSNEFNNSNYAIIPIDLKFNLSLSRILGTLVYAIDSQNNQLIISLLNGINQRMKVNFRGSEVYIELNPLCKCNPCQYQWLSFHIRIDNKLLKIKCNEKKFEEIAYSKEIKLITGYPSLEKSEQLIIYFINIPDYGQSVPNNEQLEGCFKEALLNGKSMNFNSYPKDLPKCKKSCSNNICNSGKCYETFSKNVICDCTDTFLNGKYCNSSNLILKENETLVLEKFDFMKIIWKSISSKILYFDYKNFNFSIIVENGSLLAVYQEKNLFLPTIKGTLLKMYNTSANYTLFISFKTKSINFKLITYNVTVSGEFAVPRNISEENIINYTLINSNSIDIVYKNDLSDYTWNTVFYSKSEKRKYKNKHPEIHFFDKEKEVVKTKPNFFVTHMILLFCICLALEILAIIVSIVFWVRTCKKHKKSKNAKNTYALHKSYSPIPPEYEEIT